MHTLLTMAEGYRYIFLPLKDLEVNCTPFVSQYGILSNKWGVYYAKRNSKQTIHTRIQAAGRRDNAQGKSKL